MDQWAEISKRFDEWTSPLRPCPEDVQMYKNRLKLTDKTLLLGVTPELQPLANTVVDHNPHVISNHQSRAVLADWADLPFESEFDTVIGDGALCAFQGSSELFFEQMKKVLKPNGRLILRMFISPESREPLDEVFAQKERIGFHAFKWKVAHALPGPYIPVKELHRAIRPIWNHPTLSVYEHSELIYYFPKLSELPPWSHIQFGSSYELAERCPVITWQFTNSSNFPGGNFST